MVGNVPPGWTIRGLQSGVLLGHHSDLVRVKVPSKLDCVQGNSVPRYADHGDTTAEQNVTRLNESLWVVVQEIFLDTNVLVAAFATRGLCADVLRTVLAEHELIVGEIVIAEIDDVLARRIKLPPDVVADVVAVLRAQEVIAKPASPSDIGVRDPDDRWILASAVAGRADVLVAGDQDLLAIATQAPLPILNPRGLWDRLRSRS